MHSATVKIVTYLRELNRKRLIHRKVNFLKKHNPEYPNRHTPPKIIQNVLIIHFQAGWGDFLYFSGLITTLRSRGLNLIIGTSTDLIDRFQRISSSLKIIDVTKKPFTAPKNIDCVVDLDWNVTKQHNMQYIKFLDCWSITCSNILNHLNIFDQYIDISQIPHISNRYAKVVEALTNSSCERILPCIELFNADKLYAKQFLDKFNLSNKRFIYLNTVGSSESRNFSLKQISSIIRACIERGIFVVHYSPNYDLRKINSPNLCSIEDIDFFQLAAIISKSSGIISPDTSIVHLASAFDIPVFAVFCQNDYDCFGLNLKSETWTPLSKNSTVVDTTVKNKLFSKVKKIRDLNFDFYLHVNTFLKSILSNK